MPRVSHSNRANSRRRQAGSGALLWVCLALLVAFVGWQIYLGRTIEKIGIPGVFMIDLGDPPPPPPRFHMSEVENGIDRTGSDIRDYPASDINDCLQACLALDECTAVSFNQTSRQCWLKRGGPMRQSNPGFASAVKVRE